MNLSLEQVFYGRGERGYGVLGASPGGRPLAPRVEALCNAVGTPDADWDGEPFLLSVPEGGRVVMLCGRRGAPDSMGRGTLFFHALAAAKEDLAAAGADAFSLFEDGAFADRLAGGAVEPARIAFEPAGDGSAGRAPDGRAGDAAPPRFVRSPRPAPDAVRAIVGNRANDLSWATFAFRPLDGFDVQVLPPRAAAPLSADECGADGALLRAAGSGRAAPSSPAGRGGARPPAKPSAALAFSLLANLALLACCVALLVSRRGAPSGPAAGQPAAAADAASGSVRSQPDPGREEEIRREAVEAYRADLLSAAPSGSLRDLPGFDGVGEWGNDGDGRKRESFRTLERLEKLLETIRNPTQR